MTQTLGSLTNFVTPKQSGMPGESSGNGHRSYWRMQGANSAAAEVTVEVALAAVVEAVVEALVAVVAEDARC